MNNTKKALEVSTISDPENNEEVQQLKTAGADGCRRTVCRQGILDNIYI